MKWTTLRLSSLGLLIFGLGLDFQALSTLVYAELLGNGIRSFVFWHGAAVCCGTLGLFGIASDSYRKNRITTLLLFMLSFPKEEIDEKKYRIGTGWFTETQVQFVKNRPLVHDYSILEILGGMDSVARRNAILALRNLDPRKSIPVLEKAVQDSDEQVRILAQTQFNRISGMLEKRIKQLEAILESGTARTDILVQLAEQYHELVYLGLSKQETVGIHLNRALNLLEKAHQKDQDDISVQLLQMRCQLRLKNLSDVENTLKNLKIHHSEPEITLPWEAELYFLQRRWSELTGLLKLLQNSHTVSPLVHNLADFWLNHKGVSHE